jgi:hypothetical protein
MVLCSNEPSLKTGVSPAIRQMRQFPDTIYAAGNWSTIKCPATSYPVPAPGDKLLFSDDSSMFYSSIQDGRKVPPEVTIYKRWTGTSSGGVP